MSKYLERAIRIAQKKATEEGIAIGERISVPDEDYSYILREIKGDVAIGFIPAENSSTGQEIVKEFPLDEILNVNVAHDISLELKARDMLQNRN